MRVELPVVLVLAEKRPRRRISNCEGLLMYTRYTKTNTKTTATPTTNIIDMKLRKPNSSTSQLSMILRTTSMLWECNDARTDERKFACLAFLSCSENCSESAHHQTDTNRQVTTLLSLTLPFWYVLPQVHSGIKTRSRGGLDRIVFSSTKHPNTALSQSASHLRSGKAAPPDCAQRLPP